MTLHLSPSTRKRLLTLAVLSPPAVQVVLTLAAVAYTGTALCGGLLSGPAAIILGGGLALSTTAVGMQVGGAAVRPALQ